jgi:hypothetical protein
MFIYICTQQLRVYYVTCSANLPGLFMDYDLLPTTKNVKCKVIFIVSVHVMDDCICTMSYL